MLWKGKDIVKYIHPVPKQGQIQPNGVDIRIMKAYKFKSSTDAKILQNTVLKPSIYEIKSNNGAFCLKRGTYIVRYLEKITIPKGVAGLMMPRSSLMRCGSMLNTALWDSGYSGQGIGLLQVSVPLTIEENATIGQIIFIPANKGELYSGQYMDESVFSEQITCHQNTYHTNE